MSDHEFNRLDFFFPRLSISDVVCFSLAPFGLFDLFPESVPYFQAGIQMGTSLGFTVTPPFFF